MYCKKRQNHRQMLARDLGKLNASLKAVLAGSASEECGAAFQAEFGILRQLFMELHQQARRIEIETEDRYRQLQLSYIALEERYAQSYTFRFIQEQISRELNSDELLHKTIDVVMGVFGSRKSIVYMADEAKNALVAKAALGYKDRAGRRGYKEEIFFTEDNFYIRAYRERRAFTTMVGGGGETRGEKYQIIMVPLNARLNCLGLIVMEVDIARDIDAELLEFVESIAKEVSLSLENAYLYDKMRRMAIRDGLTDAYNRMYLMTYMTELFGAKPDNVSVIIFDLDHFKQINDKFGHLNGDLVLKATAEIAATAVTGGILARYGGEEFVIVLPDTGQEVAWQISETVRHMVEEHQYLTAEGSRMPVTLSAGLANFPRVASNYEELLQLADHALYQAKNSGRNRICVAG
jgi:diguanylate cyclase (GGDEF)-like protein